MLGQSTGHASVLKTVKQCVMISRVYRNKIQVIIGREECGRKKREEGVTNQGLAGYDVDVEAVGYREASGSRNWVRRGVRCC